MKKLNKYLLYSLIYLIAMAGIYIYDAGRQVDVAIYSQNSKDSNTGEILAGTLITQEFTTNGEEISSIDLTFATYGRKNKGNLIVTIKDGNDESKVLKDFTVDLKAIKDNVPYRLNTDLQNSYGDKILIEITSDVTDKNNAVTVWYNSSTTNHPLYINGEKINGELMFNINVEARKGLRL